MDGSEGHRTDGLPPVRRRAVAAVLVGLTGTVLAVTGANPAVAQACSSFAAVAAADGARIAAASPGFALVERTETGAPAAQAAVDSAGSSRAFAGYPYPGEEVLSVLPLIGAPRSSYPSFAESSYPQDPDGSVEAPAVTLSARSDERASSATGRSGMAADDGSSGGVVSSTADAACADDGTVTAAAESLAEALTFGDGVLRIGRVRSMARVTIGSDGTPVVESSLDVGQVTVAGQTVGFGEGGLEFGDSAAPVPANPLADALNEAGLDVSYVAATTQPDGSGVVAPALRVELRREAVGTGATVVTYTFGRATASARAAADALVTAAIPTLPAAAPTSPAPRPAGSAPALSLPPSAPAGAPAADARGARIVPPVEDVVASPSGAVTGFSSWSIYLVIVLSAMTLLGGSKLLRIMGVEARWT